MKFNVYFSSLKRESTLKMLNIIYILHSLSAKAQTHGEYYVFVYSLFLLIPVVEVEYTPTPA